VTVVGLSLLLEDLLTWSIHRLGRRPSV